LNYFNKGSLSYGNSCRSALSASEIGGILYEAVIAPNPAYGVVNLTFPYSSWRVLSLCNSLGQVVYSNKSVEREVQLDVSHLSNGLYILSVSDESGHNSIKKLIVAN
jgi:hypothetical protein